MRALLRAALLLAPALVTSFVVRPGVEDATESNRVVDDRSHALIRVDLPSSYGDSGSMTFHLDVLPSENACGLANVTVNGQVLPQKLNGELSEGGGSITVDRKQVVVASWYFQCVKVDGQPDSQFMKFMVDFVDGKAAENVGFSALFRQTGSTELLNIATDPSPLDEDAANPDPDRLQSASHEGYDFPQLSIEQEMEELHWLRAQQKELEFLIWTKERAIAEHPSAHLEEDIQECDSLKCVARAVVDKASKAAHQMIGKIHGHHGDHGRYDVEDEEVDRFSKHKKPGHKKHGNHTCGLPKHGNHSAPPPWKRPHHRPLPICRYPPPPKHGGPPGKHDHHPPPPPHSPNGDMPPPPPPPGPHRGFSEDEDMPPPPPGPHGHFPHDGPEGHHGGSDHEMGHHDLPHDEMRHHDGPFDGPRPDDGSHEEPHGGPHGRPQDDQGPPGPPGFEAEAPFHLFDSEEGPPGPPFDGPGPGGPPHNGARNAFHIIKFVVIGVLLSLFGIAIHRRARKPSKRADRLARREERHRRQAFRRAARKHAITNFFARISGHDSDEDSDYEEKRQALLAGDAEDGMSTTMTEEITEFRNAADVVDDIVIESSRRSHPIPVPTPSTSTASVSENRPLIERDYDIGSQVGDGEELPAYEDNDGSEMSSVVADGFRYTPGSTEYSPSHSPAGSVSDILGPDTKQ